MEELIRCFKAQIKIESCFQGLPHAHTTLIKSLILRADPETGLVENLSCRDLAKMLAVDHAPGRKGAGIPKIETIRSYLRTIAKSCSDDFKLINQGQRIACQFINMPKIYAHFFDQKEVYVVKHDVQVTTTALENTRELSEEDIFWGDHEIAESPIIVPEKTHVKNINNINNNNNITTKSRIADDFQPSEETIARAIASGYHNATDFSVIQDFIDKNKAWGSQFADFQPIYLMFLAKFSERKQTKQQQTNSWRASHATGNSSFKTREPNARERVRQAHARDFIFCEETGRYSARTSHASATHCHTVVATY